MRAYQVKLMGAFVLVCLVIGGCTEEKASVLKNLSWANAEQTTRTCINGVVYLRTGLRYGQYSLTPKLANVCPEKWTKPGKCPMPCVLVIEECYGKDEMWKGKYGGAHENGEGIPTEVHP